MCHYTRMSVNKRKKAHEHAKTIYNKYFDAGEVEFIDKQTYENSYGLSHTNVSIIHVPNDVSAGELSDLTNHLQQEEFATSIEEQNNEIIIHVMYSYDVVENLGLVD